MKESLQKAIQDELPDADYPDFEPGDKIRVTLTKKIGGQQRKRHFEGVCIARRGEGPDETFKVRKVSFGVGVERIFPIHSPSIDEIEILRKGKVNQAKLNYLEDRSSKESRIEEERVDLDEVNRTRSDEGPAHAGEAADAEEEVDSEVEEDSEDSSQAEDSTEEDEASEEASEEQDETDEDEDEASEDSEAQDTEADEETEDETKEE